MTAIESGASASELAVDADSLPLSGTSPNLPASKAALLTPLECLPAEYGGRNGPEPTRYGDWEKNGRCIDF